MNKVLKLNKLLTNNAFKQFCTVKFKYRYLSDNTEVEVTAKEGQNLLEIAHNNDIDLEGACEASLACSTCHIILDDSLYKSIPEACEEEEDLLDMAFALSTTSRLGCQVNVTKAFEGTTVCIPAATRNLYVDGSKPKKH
jgi:ferredoxin